MDLPFEKVKHIQGKYKDIISGFIRALRILEIPESVQLIILLFYYNTIESSILKDDESNKLLTLFEKENVFKGIRNYSYRLLFRGTRDGFKTKTFYEKCNKKHTLCIICTPENNVFGGYTSIPWKRKDKNGIYISDASAFIYTVRNKNDSQPKVFPITNNGKNAISHDKHYYLTFGLHGNGFYCWQPEGSGNTQARASNYKCPEYNLDENHLNGASKIFKPIEIEVFHLE